MQKIWIYYVTSFRHNPLSLIMDSHDEPPSRKWKE
jgi:hypothetical protein